MVVLALIQRKDGMWDWEVSHFSEDCLSMSHMSSSGAWDIWQRDNRKTLCYEPMSLYEAIEDGMKHVRPDEEFKLVMQTNKLERKEYK